jgi:hypothetical protein
VAYGEKPELDGTGAQHVAADAQQARRLALVAVAELEGRVDDGGIDAVEKLGLAALVQGALQGRGARCGNRREHGGLAGRIQLHVLGLDVAITAGEDRAMDHVVQLAHVAWPGVIEQSLDRLRTHRHGPEPRALSVHGPRS